MIAVATTTRADWGLLTPLVSELGRRDAEVAVVASNMHLDPALGMTVREIEEAGITPEKLPTAGATPDETFSRTSLLYGRWFGTHHPEAVIILGDRYEMLAVASAALLHRVPIVHIAGGTVSEGAIDNAVRDAISRLASLHLVETDLCRTRLTAMGIDSRDIAVTGALGVWNALNVGLMNRDELEKSLAKKLPEKFFVATLHAATLDRTPPECLMGEFLRGLEMHLKQHDNYGAIITYPNNDTDPAPLIKMLEDFEHAHPGQVILVASLGMRRYLSAVSLSEGVIGNSSSGVVEVASLGVPTLDIGIRQKGRERAESVVNVECKAEAITEGLRLICREDFKELASRRNNPYFRESTPAKMADRIVEYLSFASET